MMIWAADLETRVLEPLENAFGPKMLPMWSVRGCYVSGPDGEIMAPFPLLPALDGESPSPDPRFSIDRETPGMPCGPP